VDINASYILKEDSNSVGWFVGELMTPRVCCLLGLVVGTWRGMLY